MEKGCTHRDGRTDPYYPGRVNYVRLIESTSKIYVASYCRGCSISAYLSAFFPFPSRAREREGELIDPSSFRSTFAKHTTVVRRKLFEKSSRCTSVRYWTIYRPFSFSTFHLHYSKAALLSYSLRPFSARFKPDRRNDLWRHKADAADSLLLFLLLDTQILIILERKGNRQ